MGDPFGGFGGQSDFGGDLADPKFEFAAPKFHDFFGESDEVPDDNADDWFSKCRLFVLFHSFLIKTWRTFWIEVLGDSEVLLKSCDLIACEDLILEELWRIFVLE